MSIPSSKCEHVIFYRIILDHCHSERIVPFFRKIRTWKMRKKCVCTSTIYRTNVSSRICLFEILRFFFYFFFFFFKESIYHAIYILISKQTRDVSFVELLFFCKTRFDFDDTIPVDQERRYNKTKKERY